MHIKYREYITPALIGSIGRKSFSRSFLAAFSDVSEIDHCTAFAFDGGNVVPVAVAASSNCVEKHAAVLSSAYIGHDWKQDSVAIRLHQMDMNFVSVDDQFSHELPSSQYHGKYYHDTGIKHEISVTGDVEGCKFYLGLYRMKGQDPFSNDELELVKGLKDTLLGVLAKQYELTRDASQKSVTETDQCLSQYELFGKIKEVLILDDGKLSEREAEVCAGIAIGYSADALSLNLGISKNTVATHRKRAYAKLNICSQNQLFTRFFLRDGTISSANSFHNQQRAA